MDGPMERCGSVRLCASTGASDELSAGRYQDTLLHIQSRAFDAEDLGHRQREAPEELLKQVSGSRA